MRIELAFASAVAARLNELGVSARLMEKKAGLPADAIRNIIGTGTRQPVPSIVRAHEVCEILDMDFSLGPKANSAHVKPADQYEFLPRFNVAIGAGSGSQVDGLGPSTVDHMAFRRDWLRSVNVKPDQACLLDIRGDSMAPTLLDKDMALANMGANTPVSKKVYAFTDIDGLARVKRFEVYPDRILLRSDNPDFLTEVRAGDDMNAIRIIGEIIWSARSWR
jgi:phage repressor protein C with HTH and peptisase S24 domain